MTRLELTCSELKLLRDVMEMRVMDACRLAQKDPMFDKSFLEASDLFAKVKQAVDRGRP